MSIWKRSTFCAIGFFLALPGGLFAQAGGGKLYAKIGDWQIKKFPKYCVASVSFEGDRGLRLHSGSDLFSFGFMGPGSGSLAKAQVTFWFDNNKKLKQTRTAVKRMNQAEDGGAPWLVMIDPANEPGHASDFEFSKSVTFTYRADGAMQTETFSLKNGKAAYAKLFQCSGQ